MSCAAATLLTFYAALTNQPNTWVVDAIVVLAVLFLLVAAFGAWLEERNKVDTLRALVDERLPKFEIRIGQILTNVSDDLTQTTFNVPIEVINHGGRSSCFSWEMKYEFPGFSNTSKSRRFYDDQMEWPLRDGGHLVMDQNNSIVNATSHPLERNDYRTGRALFVLSGDRRREMDCGQAKITISCYDIHGKQWSSLSDGFYPAPELLTYHHERVIIAPSPAPKLLTQSDIPHE